MLKKEANFPTLLIFPPFKKMSICLSLYFVPWHLGRCCLPNKNVEQRRASPFHFYSIVSLIFTLKQTFLFSLIRTKLDARKRLMKFHHLNVHLQYLMPTSSMILRWFWWTCNLDYLWSINFGLYDPSFISYNYSIFFVLLDSWDWEGCNRAEHPYIKSQS